MSGDLPSPRPDGHGPEAQKAVDHAARDNNDPAFTQQNTATTAETEMPVQQTRNGVGKEHPVVNGDGIDTFVGPLLNYRRMSKEHTESPVWHGSVLIVTAPGSPQPQLRIRMVRSEQDEIVTGAGSFTKTVYGDKLYEEPKGAFWVFPIEVPFQVRESQWEYVISGLNNKSHAKVDPSAPKHFWIPPKTESMRIMFHSCNGFSVGTDVDAWSGCALWNDVLRVHQKRPIHVMIGGGDQIYNDGVRVAGPLKPWTDISNPRKRRDFPFNEDLRDQCDKYYFDNYVRWYGTEPFATANCQIPQLNIWDDHDIIDGFGSYTDHFMQCPVFRGIGGIAHKYYLLFQHHLPPPKSTYTTDAPATTSADDGTLTAGTDAVQLKNSWVKIAQTEDPSYIIGQRPGPYVEEKSRSMYSQLGARMAFVGIDARTERTRHQINYPQTYDLIFDRVNREIAASNGTIKHLILLLGVPIAYPRLQWLENILQSPIIGPVRFLNKRFGFAGGFFNAFDGGVDLMDDLDDHYTARQHKKERKSLILRLQHLAQQHNLRISILGGDVHLAALGRFYSHPKLGLAPENDWRYMPNIVSSAITNKPPPTAVANLLARRNKIHHLDHDTDETLLNLFDEDPGKPKGLKPKSADSNHCTMPSRNYALISESSPASSSATPAGLTNGHVDGQANGTEEKANEHFSAPSNPRDPLHRGEVKCGVNHPAAGQDMTPTGLGGPYGLDVCIRVEVDPSDREGVTRGYGLSIPGLSAGK
ncbi:Alkaline phosphatase D [Elsinoe australis]|uniref:Alkaline phosphatase D n=1 Tax=Elsinoe australis TaxID=40998 RepID=A0A2P8A4L2_9PEZI|nr:Alkaline phosphatase D [Elsinoe australis]